MSDTVTPQAGTVSVVAAGTTPVEAIPANPKGGFITNPATAADQGNSAPDALPENLYVSPVGLATLEANGTTFSLAPGQSWSVIANQTTATSVNAATSGHKFSVVWWP